jgi:ubiquinone/menaquinone biosynthesis C-methylase UbiE
MATGFEATTGFRAVDRSGDPRAHVGYLDAAGGLAWARAYKRRTFALLEPRPGGQVLDLGCGTGDDVRALAALVAPGGRAVGVDASETMVAEALARSAAAGPDAPAAEFRVGDAHRLPFAGASFDGCRADRTLQHVEDPGRALGELVRVARPGARIVVSEPDWETLVVDAPDRAATRRILNARCDRMRHGWIGRRLPGLFLAAGLRRVDVTATSLVMRDLATAERLLTLEASAARARDDGLISAAGAAAWVAGLRAADAAGRFFAAGTLFIVVGERA